jgi:hypothetical protein
MRLEGSRVLPAYIILATTSLVLVESVEQSKKRKPRNKRQERVHTGGHLRGSPDSPRM